MAHFSRFGSFFRVRTAALCGQLLMDADINVVRQSPDLLDKTIARYQAFADKQWSAVDCASMIIMEDHGIEHLLGADHHFSQAGFQVLM